VQDNDKERILEILSAEGLLSEKQVQFIKSKEVAQRAKILKFKSSDIRYKSIHQSSISLIDIIESLQISSPPPDSRVLTAEVMLETISKHLNLPFLKIDPLKLDSDVVTRIISKPYAVRHQLVPIDLSDGTLTVWPYACYRPYRERKDYNSLLSHENALYL
jgi:general secretion pathway protein E